MTQTATKNSGLPEWLSKYVDPFKYGRFLEPLLLRRSFATDKPQLFILGLPRSGTTLVYQYIVHRLNVAYFTNGVGRYPYSPFCITAWQKWRYGHYQSSFQNRFGKTDAPLEPREAGGFWGRFFDMEAYIRYDDIPPATQQSLQKSIAAIQHLYGNTAFVNKNVKHMLRLDALAHIFPRSLFLVVERNLAEVGLSVLHARCTLLQNPHDWWSVRPPDYEQIKTLPVVEQIAHQLLSLQQKMTADLAQIDTSRIIYIPYATFCQEPEYLINQIYQPLDSPGYRNPPVPSFMLSQRKPKNEQEQQLVQRLRQTK